MSIVISVGVALPSPAANAKKSFTKATVARSSFRATTSPARPADSLLEGLDGRVLEDYDDITLVEINEKDQDKLKQRGDEADVLVTLREDFDKVFLNGKILDAREDKKLPPPGEQHDPPYHGDENGAYLIQFVGPIKTEWLERAKAEGIVPVQYIQMHAYIVGARESAIKAIEDLPFIQWTLQMHRFLKPAVGDRSEETIELWIELAETSETDDAVAVLAKMSIGEVDVGSLTSSERRVQGTFATKDIDTILAQPLVFGIAERPAIGLSDERSALGVTGLVPSAGSPAPQAGKYKKWLSDLCPACTNLQNDGFYLGIADTGLDGGDIAAGAANAGEPGSTDLHRDELPKSKVAWGTSFEDTGFEPGKSWSNCLASSGACVDSTGSKHDTIGHGTLVAGIAAGNPLPAGGKDADGFFLGLGVAPSAGIVVTKVSSKRIGNGTTALLDVTRNARTEVLPHAYWQNFSLNQYYNSFVGSRVCSNLYDGAYSILSRDFDIAVRDADNQTTENQPITITTSSGNIDQQFKPATRWNPAECPGVDLTMTLPPATAKNVIAIGGGENVRPDPWLCRSSRADDFMNLAINAKHGTGYTNYYKPDLIAVASNIASPWSNDGVFASFCGAYGGGSPPPLPAEYDSSTGTSFSAPVGLAAATLASRRFSADPAAAKPALVKAMLIAGAKSMRGGRDRASLRIWKASDAFLLYYPGNRVLPTTPNEHWYEIESVGSSGYGQTTTEPTVWPTHGETITTGSGGTTITWRDKGLEAETLAIGAVPNRKQGFGRIALQDVLSDYPMRAFINETVMVSAGGSWSRDYIVHDLALPVRVALVWTDAPTIFNGNVPFTTPSLLINDLHLSVEVKQSGGCVGRYVGNVLNATTEESIFYQPCTAGTSDTTNNVEVVRFFAATPLGNTTFTVKVASASGQAQDFGLVVWNAYDADTVMPPPPTPSNFKATATSTSQVSLTWDASSGASSYEVQRSSGVSGPYVAIGTPSTNLFMDSGRTSMTTYLYRVRARNTNGLVPAEPQFSDWSVDPATTILFTDPVITTGVTTAKAIHITELRQAVSSLRAAAELSAFTWSDDPIVAGTTMIRAVHVSELRTALNQGRTALGLAALIYTDGTLAPGAAVVKRVHIQELRDGF